MAAPMNLKKTSKSRRNRIRRKGDFGNSGSVAFRTCGSLNKVADACMQRVSARQ
jgi:hypothetical protein